MQLTVGSIQLLSTANCNLSADASTSSAELQNAEECDATEDEQG